jgi:hypothetical protein
VRNISNHKAAILLLLDNLEGINHEKGISISIFNFF